ncbi:hypothetical protein I4U23_003265 [Adineta vaga]|nr:hypothetical protein I4U23_003265 [Adineta vaga]
MSPLSGKTFVLELGREIRFKAKQELINYLREQNAQISYILTASTDYVLVSNDIDTYKTRRAKQLGIPLVNVDYIHECRKSEVGKEPSDIKRFIVTSAEDKENFSKTGTIPVSGGGSSSGSVIKPVKYDVSKIKIWNSDDVELPCFDEITHAEIGKWAIFKETNDHSDIHFALELQIISEEYYHQQTNNDYQFRFRYEKQTIISSKGKTSLIQYAFSHDINELHQLFASYYYRIATMPRITRIRELLPDKLGSKLLLRSLFLHRIDTQMLDDNVCQLIESLWIESIGDLNKILSVQPESIALKTIIEAEAALLEIKSGGESASEAETRFYSLIPHQYSYLIDLITNRRALIDKIDLCQMLRDMLTINELTNWNIKASIEAKYRALKCHIESIDRDSHEYSTINNMIHSSTDSNEKVIVHHIYSVAKQIDALNFRSTLFNQKQLFHGSKYNNFLGILSRGLMLPKLVVDDLGVARTDFGCLGYGIYFSDSVSTSLKYTTSSTTCPGRRLLCISQVALGESAKYYSYATNLTQPPENCHSTHGVKKTNENNSKFFDDEYVIYNLDQQRLLYIVEVSWQPHDVIDQPLKLLPIIRDHSTKQLTSSKNEMDIPSSIEDEVIQVAEQDYGLVCPSSGQLVPLKAFHIRAQLVDVTGEVVLYQVYHNTSSVPIEAKYVFPLEENCSVCGFEAHINNKVIKGVVKEKEQAKREYREAIEKGHGAYLMHQEQPEVFSVSVGNLPANCEVIIKITYVAELSIENNDIIFRFPAKVASWQSKQALEAKDQTILPSINLEQDNSSMKSVEFSLKTSIRMPYEISKLFSPTHRLRRKVTDCLAMIELVDNVLLEKDFILSITLKSINLPRMLNETYVVSDENNNIELNDEQSQACMLTFYPKFEMTNNINEFVEVVFIIDVSNSMDGNHVQQAKQLAHLFLTNMNNNDGNIYFNIVTFGSDNDECFPISSPNTKENIDKAKHFILHSLDHRGNTDLFSVLRQYSLLPSPCKLGRQFILLSDGHINDLNSIITLLENQPSMAHDRFFTCSISDTSNKHQLKQLTNGAHGGGLATVFDSNYRSKWKSKVLLILEHIRQPCVTNISIDWHGNLDNQQVKFTNQAPKMIRSLFNGMRLTVYRFIQNCHKATLTAMINDQEFVTTVFSNKMTETRGTILHCLTARAIIHDYENGILHVDESENELMKKQYKQDLIDLSIKYSVVSSFTSFVAIEERDGQALEPGVRLLDVMLEHDIDLLPYIGWDGDRSQIQIIKEKLLDAKHLFDSASISNKIQLTTEYEKLCQNISYRSGGDAKYDLMLAIIETYRTMLKENNKALELEEKMQLELLTEITNATADERKILEKRLEEVNARINTAESESQDEGASSEDIDSSQDSCDEEVNCSNILLRTCSMGGDDSYSMVDCDIDYPLDFEVSSTASKPAMNPYKSKGTAIALSSSHDESEGSDDMGFGLFDDGVPASYSPVVSNKLRSSMIDDKKDTEKIAAAAKIPQMLETMREYEDDEDEADDFGFDLFGDYSSSSPAATVNLIEKEEHSKRSTSLAKRQSPPNVQVTPIRDLLEETKDLLKSNLNKILDRNFGISTLPHPSMPSFTFGAPQFNNNTCSDPFSTSAGTLSASTNMGFNTGPPPPPPPMAAGFFGSTPPSSNSLFQPTTASGMSYNPLLPDAMLQQVLLPAQPPPPMAAGFFGSTMSPGAVFQQLPLPPPPPPPPPMAAGFFGSTTSSSNSFYQPTIATGMSYSHMPPGAMPQQVLLPPPPPPPLPAPPRLQSIKTIANESGFKMSLADDEESSPMYSALQHKQRSSMVSRDRGRGVVFGGRCATDGAEVLSGKKSEIIKEISVNDCARYCDTRSDEASNAPVKSATSDYTEDYNIFSKKKSSSKRAPEKKPVTKYVDDCLYDLLLLDVTPLGLGIEDVNGEMCTIIERNRTIPTKSNVYSIFTNAYAYQTTATIRIFHGQHKLTKYNIFLGELILKDLTPNFASQTLQISIVMDVANSFLQVNAEEPRSGAKAMIKISASDYSLSATEIERHITYVESDPNYRAVDFNDAQKNNRQYKLKGDTESTAIRFTGNIESSNDVFNFDRPKTIQLISTTLNEIKKIQLPNGSFDINEDFTKLFSIPMKNFDELKKYLCSQGFNSFALNVQQDIIHLIATGIVLLQLLLQVPVSDRKGYLVPFDKNVNKAIDFYEQKRLRCGIYCEQLELKYSSWEKLIQYGIFQIEN